MCRFHWILLNIQIDKGVVEVMDSLKKNFNEFQEIQDMLQL
jgi:hypothetical protein